MPDVKGTIKQSECTKINCPMQAGTKTDNCGKNCPWRTTAKASDLISRAALLKDLSYCAPELWQDEEYIKAKIMKQHAVDAMPTVHAHWIYRRNGWAECSACHHDFIGVYDLENSDNYCRHCGAKMDEGVK